MVTLKSILDNDFYKFTMQHAVIKLFPHAKVEYQFFDRGETKFPEGFSIELKKSISRMAGLSLTPYEVSFLRERCRCLSPPYIDFLKGYRFDPDEVSMAQKRNKLTIQIKGYWYRAILWEVPVLSIVSELYFKMTGQKIITVEEIIDGVKKKAAGYNAIDARVVEFGTRRRYSFENQDVILRELTKTGRPSFLGTSNLHFAMKYRLTPIGTHAHEWFMFHGAKYGCKMANSLALKNWADVYQGDLGIALSDTFTSEVFFRDFDKQFSKVFDGVRQDSGDPFAFADKAIAHYLGLDIEPNSKTIVFSDELNPVKVKKLVSHCKGKIKTVFGIGTNFTNDVGVCPLKIVIKMIKAKPEGDNWISVVKLSDSSGKIIGDPDLIRMFENVLNVQNRKPG